MKWFERALVLLLVGGCSDGTARRAAEGFPLDLEAYSVQMHLHGHSHHNGSSHPASMQWHSHFAAEHELDVLWWTDHKRVLDQSVDVRLDVLDPSDVEGYAEPASLQLIEAPEGTPKEAAEPRTGDGPMLLRATSEAGDSEFAEFVYAFRGPGKRKFGDQAFNRPISSGAELIADLEGGAIGVDARVEIEVRLSWHHRGKPRLHELRYRLVDPVAATDRSAREPFDERAARIDVLWTPGRHQLTLDLEADAGILRDGTDNSLTDFRIVLAARNGARTDLRIHRLELRSRDPEPDHQIARMREFAGRYEAEYEHRQHVGIEYGARPDKALHLNAFFPGGAMTGELAMGDDETYADPAEFVRRVHAAGGVVSYNHIFGTRGWQAKPRQQALRSRQMALALLDNGAWGCDVLEVGYRARGGVGLDYHLRTWDILTANGLFLYGNGVSDSHGGVWRKGMKPNPYSTWIWATDPSAEALLEGIRSGRMVFGDGFRYRGQLYFRVGEHEMGDRTRTSAGERPLRVEVDERFDPERHRLYLVQGLIDRAGDRVTYLTGEEDAIGRKIEPGSTIPIDVSNPTFVRIELYDVEGHPLLFTNPIVFDG